MKDTEQPLKLPGELVRLVRAIAHPRTRGQQLLQELNTEGGIPIADIAKHCGCATDTALAWCRGTLIPDRNQAKALASLGIPIGAWWQRPEQRRHDNAASCGRSR